MYKEYYTHFRIHRQHRICPPRHTDGASSTANGLASAACTLKWALYKNKPVQDSPSTNCKRTLIKEEYSSLMSIVPQKQDTVNSFVWLVFQNNVYLTNASTITQNKNLVNNMVFVGCNSQKERAPDLLVSGAPCL